MTDIEELRDRIDSTTVEMIKLLKIRIDTAKEIGNIKKNIGKSVSDEERENKIREKIVSICKEIDLDETIGTKFLNLLLNESIKVQSSNIPTHLSIFLKAKSLEQQGKDIIHMEVGEPDFKPPIEVKNALEEVYDKGFFRYGHAKGLPEFRKALAEKTTNDYGINTSSDEILITPGARFSIFLAMTTLLNQSDEIIVIEPAWPAYKDCALHAGVKVRVIKTTLANDWEPSIEEVHQTVNKNTKMIVLNYPNNPTGKIISPQSLDKIMKIAIDSDLYVLSDEIYSQYAYKEWKSVLKYNYKKSIITQSFSKSHAMTGFRIGYSIANSEIINKMTKLQALCLTNVSEPIQYVALQALNANVSENPKIMQDKLKGLTEKASQMGLEFLEPDGAMYIFVKNKIKDIDGTKFSEELLDHGLAVAPGEGFGDYKEFLRISACQDKKKLIEGMSILDQFLGEKNE